MNYKIIEITFEDLEKNLITQKYIKTRKGYIHLPIKTGEIVNLKKVKSKKQIGEIDLDLPAEFIIIKQDEVIYQKTL